MCVHVCVRVCGCMCVCVRVCLLRQRQRERDLPAMQAVRKPAMLPLMTALNATSDMSPLL